MASQRRYKLKRGFWISLAILILWKSIPPAIYFLFKEVYNFPSIFMSVVGILLIVLLIRGKVWAKVESRGLQLFEIALPMLLFTAIALQDLGDAITMEPLASTGYLFWRINYIGTVVIFVVVIWQLITSITAGHSESSLE